MRTIHELAQWVEGAYEEFGDPADVVCQIFCRWFDPIEIYRGDELACGTLDGETVLKLGPGALLPLPIETSTNGTMDREGVCRYGATQLMRGVWYLNPSLNLPGMIHAFVTIYGVPEAPPWEKKILVVPSFNDRAALAVIRGGR